MVFTDKTPWVQPKLLYYNTNTYESKYISKLFQKGNSELRIFVQKLTDAP
jgi:hypothetical protein